MANRSLVGSFLLLVGGVVIGVLIGSQWRYAARAAQPAAAPATAATPAAAAASLPADVAHLKDIIPAQSHTMIDVGWHMQNLWFAAQKKNWPLAAFEVDETRNRIRWTIRINPTRKDAEGKEVDLKGIFDGIDTSSLPALKQAVEKKDSKAFVSAYRQMLESCYACHKTSGKPYLRPMIPTAPPQSIINFDPAAPWPS
jgi:cytochrome c553